MTYTSEVFIVVSGKKSELTKFIDTSKAFCTQKEKEILSRFKWVQMEGDRWIYVFNDLNFEWDNGAEHFCQILSYHARFHKLFFMFYRA